MISKVKNDLFDYKNRYIMQMKDGFKFSLDSLLLAEFVNIKKDDKKILDMCTGNAPVPLVLSLKTEAEIIGFEIQKEISELALESVKINGNKNDFLSLARHEIAINLETIFKIASKYLKSNKAFYLVHRVERLDDIIVLARENKLNVKELQFISTKKEKSANTILIKCVKNSKPGIKLRKEICVDNLDTYQHLFESEVF